MTKEEKLEEAKRLYKTANSDQKYVLERLFPELKESEDEKIRQLLLRFVKYDMSDNYSDDFTPADCVAWLEKQGKNNMGISEATKKKLEDNLNKALEKETPESFNEFLDEQNPAWSEEDEVILGDIIKDLVHPWNEYIPDRIEDEIKWLKNRLKSLRPQSTWKPSDKQMAALSDINVTGCISYAGQGQELINLYNDLKKLKRE